MSRTEISPHGLEARCRSDFWPRSRFYQGQYGRLFRELPPIRALSGAELDEYLEGIREKQPSLSSQAEASTMPAGYTYFGQFVAHDITFNPVSDLTQHRDPESIVNFRSPRLDLDSLYGRGPKDSAYFYDRSEGAVTGRLSIGWGMGYGEEDLPRSDGEPAVALIGDPRNDENTMISQIHLAFIKLHNRFLDYYKDFATAQRLTCWHYQWVVLKDYLYRVCEDEVLKEIWSNPKEGPKLRWFEWKQSPFIPLEFSGAALRFGHSMVRDGYRLNFTHHNPVPVFSQGSLGNLRGFRRLPPNWTVQWDHFLQFDDNGARETPQLSRPIDLVLSKSLMDLPREVLTANDREKVETNLLKLNIQRGFQLSLPSGQAVARALRAKKVLKPLHGDEDPLWVYVLREAMARHGGTQLGEVGSTIVAETIIGLIAGDPLSYLNVDPNWTPDLPPKQDLKLRDLIREAGMPIVEADLRKLPAFRNEYDPRVPLVAKMHSIRKALKLKRKAAFADR